MDLLDPFSCQLHHIVFDRLKSHTQLPCPGTQSINIPLKFYCVFFILNFPITNTVISKKSYLRLNIWWDVIYVQREQQGTKNGALGYTRQNRSPVRFYSIYNNRCFLKQRKESIHFNVLPPIPSLNNLLLRSSWGVYQMPFQNPIWMCQPVLCCPRF